MTSIAATCALAVLAYMTALFLLALVRRDNSLADVGWGLGFVLVAAVGFAARPVHGPRAWLVTGLVGLWGFRLAGHILLRNRKKGEDFRYAKWRADWGKWFVLRSYLQVFLLQGAILLVVSAPILIVAAEPGPGLGLLDAAGTAVWLTGFFFEAAGDAQLARFKRDAANRGRIMTTGLWRFTRHPNYFGEATMWWGIFLIALSAPGGAFALASPVVLTFMLLRVSGVTLLERKYAGRPDFAAYARRTSAFFPLPPRKAADDAPGGPAV